MPSAELPQSNGATTHPVRKQALYEATAMTQPQPAYDPDIRAAAGERDMIAALVETQTKIARGLTIHGLIAGVAIALGVPLIVLNLAPINEWMPWVVVCSAAITGTGIIITTLAVVIVTYLRISRCLMKILERDRAA
jgi:hypothetical protein